MITRLGIVLLLVCAGVLAPAPATAEPVQAAATALWVRPLPAGPVARPFQPPPSPYAAGHRGVDLAGAPRAPVLAAGDGVVVFAGMVAGRPVVSIDHAGGLRTTYEPVDPSVGAGQPVARGSPIGTLLPGHSGCPAAACLHWGLRRGETYLDPMLLLGPRHVRLLPLGRSRPGTRVRGAGAGGERRGVKVWSRRRRRTSLPSSGSPRSCCDPTNPEGPRNDRCPATPCRSGPTPHDGDGPAHRL